MNEWRKRIEEKKNIQRKRGEIKGREKMKKKSRNKGREKGKRKGFGLKRQWALMMMMRMKRENRYLEIEGLRD